MLTFHDAFNFPIFFHPIFNADKISFIFHLHHGNIAPLMKVELALLFSESLAELMTPTYNVNANSPPSLHIRLIPSSTLMEPLVEGQETRAQHQLSLEDHHSSLMWSPPSNQKEEHVPAPMRRKQLPWNQRYPRHPRTLTIL